MFLEVGQALPGLAQHVWCTAVGPLPTLPAWHKASEAFEAD